MEPNKELELTDEELLQAVRVRIVTSFVLGGGALAFGLSFGLGTRDIFKNVAAGYYVRKILAIGKPLEIAGQRGVPRAVTATHVILQSDGEDTTVSNATVMDQVTKQ
jgi:hypothetical protein